MRESRAYYNEHDKFAAAWLRELITAGAIAPGDVDARSIEDVLPSDLNGYTQCHFFAGIGGWSLALRSAEWPDHRPVWTGSCPCQSFSQAGKGAGFADERHLWPAWFHLIQQCSPPVLFGEQVEAAIQHGWLDLVHDDLEGEGYAIGAAGLPAASVGAPHLRHRLWFVAHAAWATRQRPVTSGPQGGSAITSLLGHPRLPRLQGWGVRLVRDADQQSAGSSSLDDPQCAWVWCRDGKWRPIESGTFPLADGVPARVGRLRGYGNAIVPQVAKTFIQAYLATQGDI